jgi:IPT/TIG domain-containing protein
MKALIAFCLAVSTALCAEQKSTRLLMSPLEAQAGARPGEFASQYLRIQILPGWTVATSADQTLNLIQGKYLLSINPIFVHASGGIGGRFSEVVSGKQSIDAVMRNVDQPAGGFECAQMPPDEMVVTKALSLYNLYTDRSKVNNGCVFPSSGRPVWFGSMFGGEGSESDYAITLSYSTKDVNDLPKKGSLELKHVFADVVEMLKSLQLKPPIAVSKIYLQSTHPGATVTIYGSGFNVLNQSAEVRFNEFPNNPMPAPIVAVDGKSLTFQVPTSINTISCEARQIDVNEWCVPIPANHVDVDDCPSKADGSTNFCGRPLPPATYQVSVTLEGWGIGSNPVSLTVTAANPNPVSISLLYPNYGVSEGDTIIVRGRGFTSSGNAVRIGSAIVENLSSSDGKRITFQAPAPAGSSFIQNIRIYNASVSNANGQSNAISFWYR